MWLVASVFRQHRSLKEYFMAKKLLTVYPTLFHILREKNKKCMFPVGTRGLCSTVTLWELERSKEFHAATFVKIANVFIKLFFFERYIFIFFRSFSFCKITTCESDSGVCYFYFLLLCVTDSGLLGFLVYWRFLSVVLTWRCLYQYIDINIMIYSIHDGEGSGYLWVFTPQKVFWYIEIKRQICMLLWENNLCWIEIMK